jgi:hypothetical protein
MEPIVSERETPIIWKDSARAGDVRKDSSRAVSARGSGRR